MKKGFTMIELIFVIVILGILASVAIPRLAGTRQDAEISSAIANLRTLQSDVASYYSVKGNFGDNWNVMTNVPVTDLGRQDVGALVGMLKIGGVDCLMIRTSPEDYNGNGTPAALEIDLDLSKNGATGVCKTVLDAKAFTDKMPRFQPNVVIGDDGAVTGDTSYSYGVAIGSTAKIY